MFPFTLKNENFRRTDFIYMLVLVQNDGGAK